jgi:hypothetical protein
MSSIKVSQSSHNWKRSQTDKLKHATDLGTTSENFQILRNVPTQGYATQLRHSQALTKLKQCTKPSG